MMKTVQTVTIGSTTFAVPPSVKLADLLPIVALQPICTTYNNSPWKVFEYLSDESTQLTIGTKTVYADADAAENAKKAYVREREAQRESESANE
jgi:hypothetical protein